MKMKKISAERIREDGKYFLESKSKIKNKKNTNRKTIEMF
jgi:hypothetical protein